MLGHKWEPAQGTVVEAHSGSPADQGGAVHQHERSYVIEARKPTGEVVRGNVTEKSGFPHPVGAVIAVEVHSRSGEIRIDPSARTESIRGMMQAAEQMRASAGAAGAGGAVGGGAVGGGAAIAALANVFGAASQGGGVHVMGPDGQELPVHVNPGDITNLAQAIRSGDPAARQAAIDRLHELRDQARQQAAEHRHQGGRTPMPGAEGFTGSSGPTTFDEIGAPRHLPASGAGAFGEPADAFSFGQPATPSPYQQVSPPVPGSTPASFGSFDTGAGEGTVEQRIARLQQLLDKGILTESEFAAQRQQIISGI